MPTTFKQRGNFLIGLAGGFILGFAALLLPVLWLGTTGTVVWYAQWWPLIETGWSTVVRNLQGSLLPFSLVLILYCARLHRLQQLLKCGNPDLEGVVRGEQILDLCASLFFGIGVIWTAIGMRDALLHSLGDPGATAAGGAFAMLQRLVDGGILLALSTTIVGGIGGYLMRAIKSTLLGQSLNGVYMRASTQPAMDHLHSLQRIETLLESAAKANPVREPLRRSMRDEAATCARPG